MQFPVNFIIIFGLCIMGITTFMFTTIALCYSIPYISQNIFQNINQNINESNERRKYVRISDKVDIFEDPPVYSSN
jgi:hypothetical protein